MRKKPTKKIIKEEVTKIRNNTNNETEDFAEKLIRLQQSAMSRISPIVQMQLDSIPEADASMGAERLFDLLSQLAEQLEAFSKEKIQCITEEHIAAIVSIKTGIPIGKIRAEEKERLLNMEDILRQRVVGQDNAIRSVTDAILESRSGMNKPGQPIGSFFFLGPTGTGKTELAKTLAEALFNDEKAMIRFDMSEFKEEHSAALLYGAPPGYVGYEEGGLLVNKIRQQPYAVVLFDEIEKAHPSVYDIFLQIMDEGKILVVNLSKGLIGEDNAGILGSFLVTKIQLAAMSRSDIPDVSKRRPFYLYVDEFQNFATDSFSVILSEARKYGLNLTVANQYISQMTENVRDAVFGNVGTTISFRVSADDAPILVKQFEPVFDASDLIQMNNRHFVISMIIGGEKAPAFSATTLNIPKAPTDNLDEIIESSRNLYSRPRADVEAEIRANIEQSEKYKKDLSDSGRGETNAPKTPKFEFSKNAPKLEFIAPETGRVVDPKKVSPNAISGKNSLTLKDLGAAFKKAKNEASTAATSSDSSDSSDSTTSATSAASTASHTSAISSVSSASSTPSVSSVSSASSASSTSSTSTTSSISSTSTTSPVSAISNIKQPSTINKQGTTSVKPLSFADKLNNQLKKAPESFANKLANQVKNNSTNNPEKTFEKASELKQNQKQQGNTNSDNSAAKTSVNAPQRQNNFNQNQNKPQGHQEQGNTDLNSKNKNRKNKKRGNSSPNNQSGNSPTPVNSSSTPVNPQTNFSHQKPVNNSSTPVKSPVSTSVPTRQTNYASDLHDGRPGFSTSQNLPKDHQLGENGFRQNIQGQQSSADNGYLSIHH
mgnify:CR=1 FL=1